MRPSNQEKSILEGKEANLSGVRFSSCSSRSMYFGLASLNRRMSRFRVNDDDLIPEEVEEEDSDHDGELEGEGDEGDGEGVVEVVRAGDDGSEKGQN